jgi:hypothetical protein
MEVHPGPVPRLRYCTSQWRYTAFAGGRLVPRWDDGDYPESPYVCLHRRAARYQREKVDNSFGSFCFQISPHSDQLRIEVQFCAVTCQARIVAAVRERWKLRGAFAVYKEMMTIMVVFQ